MRASQNGITTSADEGMARSGKKYLSVDSSLCAMVLEFPFARDRHLWQHVQRPSRKLDSIVHVVIH